MFSSKKGNIVLSLIIAMALWAYVVGELDPTVTQQIKNVPVELVNEQSLTDSGLSVLSQSDTTMDVTIEGKRSVVNKIEASDISATVDLSDAAKGSNELTIAVKVPERTEIQDKSINKVTIVVEESVTQEKDVVVAYTGEFKENEEPDTQQISHEKVNVSGAESLVKSVDHVVAYVSSDQVKDESDTVSAGLRAVDKNGKQVRNISLEYSNVKVTAVLKKLKDVKLNVPIQGENDGDSKKTTTAPTTVTIKGSSKDLDKVDSISTETVDLTSVDSSTEIDLVPILPEGIELSNKESKLVIKVTVVEPTIGTKEFSIDSSSVAVSGVENGLKAKVSSTTIKVTVSGKKSQLSAISKSDIKLSADLSGLEIGTRNVNLNVECSKEYSSIQCNPKQIEVIIE